MPLLNLALTHFVTLHCCFFSVDNRACIYNLSDDRVLSKHRKACSKRLVLSAVLLRTEEEILPLLPPSLSLSLLLSWAAGNSKSFNGPSHKKSNFSRDGWTIGRVGRTNQIKNVHKYESMFTLVTSLIRNKEGSSDSALLSIEHNTLQMKTLWGVQYTVLFYVWVSLYLNQKLGNVRPRRPVMSVWRWGLGMVKSLWLCFSESWLWLVRGSQHS